MVLWGEESVCMPRASRRPNPSKKISSPQVAPFLASPDPLLLNKQSSYVYLSPAFNRRGEIKNIDDFGKKVPQIQR